MAIPVSYENVSYNSPDGATFGASATEKISFYGTAPAAQRAASTQATSVFSGISTGAVSTNSLVLATLLEVCNTLTVSGLWKGQA
jgi:hypothetical protein